MSGPKSFPVGDDSPQRVSDLWTPAVILARDALDHNATWMARWVAERGMELWPHGKTTMAPELWDLQRRAGATGLTVATPWQASVALDSGWDRVLIANEALGRDALTWLAGARRRGGAAYGPDGDAAGGSARDVRVELWADSLAGVAAAHSAAGATPGGTLDICVDRGGAGGRTGTRSDAQARKIAEAVHAAPNLRLVGVAGYEGALAHERSPAAESVVREYVAGLLALRAELDGLFEVDRPMVTVGGSAFPDLVAEVWADHRAALPPTRLILRSGCYLVHDEGYYAHTSPLSGGAGLRPAMRAVAAVVSRPEPTLALVDAGRRDVSFDDGLPTVLGAIRGRDQWVPLDGASVEKLNDQHAFVRVAADAPLEVGDRLLLGLSHPCTVFDKWRVLPVAAHLPDPHTGLDPALTGTVETRF